MGAYKILLADDNTTSLKLLKAVYELEGYEVFTANDGLEALDILYSEKIDLVISDVLMPNMDGYYLCYKIRTHDKLKDIPIIIYTATYTSLSEEKVANEMGADMFIRKPAAINVLIASAREVLERPKRLTRPIPQAKATEMMHQYNAQLVEKLEQRNLELEESHKMLEMLVLHLKKAQEISHLGNWELTFATGITTWSDETCRIFGVSPEEAKPSKAYFLSFIHPDDLEMVQTAIEEAQISLLSFSFYNRIIRKDRALRYVYCESKFEFDNKGKPLRLYGIVHDITERREAEEHLRQSEANLRLIMDMLPHYISAKDREGRFIFANEALCLFYDLKPDHVIGKRLEELIPVKSEARKFLDLDRQIFETGKKNIIESITFTDAKGNLRFFNSQKIPFTPVGSNEKAVLTVAVEITETKIANEKLMMSEARHRGIFESQSNYIIRTDLQGNYSFVNNKFLKDFGWIYEGKEIIGQPSLVSVMEYHHPRLIETVGKCFDFLNEVFQVELDKPKKDGGVITTLWDFVCITDSKGQPTEIQCVGIDMSARKIAELSLQKSEIALLELNQELEGRVELRTAELQEANMELESFSYTVSHDLRTPIRAIQIFNSLLQKEFKDTADQNTNDYLNNILKCTVEMNDLINDLLEFSRLGRSEIVKNLVDMEKMVNVYAQNLASLETNKKIKIDIGKLCPANADQRIIKNVWLNLLSNAIKYSKKDGVCKIKVSCKCENGMAIYSVKDNGVGFNMEYYEKLFKPFSRLHSASDYKGTGAGLAICDRIVRKHGGEIWAESKVDEGSTFYFSLPVA